MPMRLSLVALAGSVVSLAIAACGGGDRVTTEVRRDVTPSPTVAESPKATPTQATPAPTPTPTPTPVVEAVPEGWQRHTTASIQIDLPETWEAFDLTEESLDGITAEVRRWNPEAVPLIEAISPEQFDFFAFDTESGESLSNLSIISQEFSLPVTVPAVLAQTEDLLADLGITILATNPDLTIGGSKAGSLQTSWSTDSVPVRQVQYVVLPEPNLGFVLTFTAAPDEFDALEALCEQMAQSFRVLEVS